MEDKKYIEFLRFCLSGKDMPESVKDINWRELLAFGNKPYKVFLREWCSHKTRMCVQNTSLATSRLKTMSWNGCLRRIS